MEYDRTTGLTMPRQVLDEEQVFFSTSDGQHSLYLMHRTRWIQCIWGEGPPGDFIEQGQYKIERAGQVARAAIIGDVALVAFDGKILCIDFSDPASPTELSCLELRESAKSICVQDGLLYCTCYNLIFTIIDYTNPDAPVILSTIQREQTTDPGYLQYLTSLAVAGDLCWVAEERRYEGYPLLSYTSRILEYDVSDPSAPVLRQTSPRIESISSIRHNDGLLVVTSHNTDAYSSEQGGYLDIFTVDGRPGALQHFVHLRNPNDQEAVKIGGPRAPSSYAWDGYLAVMHDVSLHINRLHRRAGGVELELVGTQYGNGWRSYLRGWDNLLSYGWRWPEEPFGYIYEDWRLTFHTVPVAPTVDLLAIEDGLVVDVGRDAQGPLLMARSYAPDGEAQDVLFPALVSGSGGIVVGASLWSGSAMIDSSPGYFDDFITTPTGIFDSRTGALLHEWALPGHHRRIDSHHLYVTANDSLHVYDLADPSAPERSTSIWVEEGAILLDSWDGWAWVSTDDALIPLDVSVPDNPVVHAGRPVDRRLNRGVVRDGLLYAVSDHTLQSFDLADPLDPRDVGYLWCADSIEDLVVSGDRVILATGEDGIYVVDVEDPVRPYPVNNLSMQGGVRRFLHVGNYLLAGGDGVLRTLLPSCGDPLPIDPPEGGEPPTASLCTALASPVPNPFNPSTELTFTLERPGPVLLAVHDALGRRVRVLASGQRGVGPHVVRWDGRDATGRAAPAGVYFARFEADGRVETRKLALVK